MQETYTPPQSLQLKRAEFKTFTNALLTGNYDAKGLLDVTDTFLHQMYLNTYYCCLNVAIVKGKVVTAYCKNRPCVVCQRNNCAKHINNYKPILETWTTQYFLTLTVQGVHTKTELEQTILEMKKVFKNTFRKIETRAKRNGFELPMMLRKLEITYNPLTGFKPHFHVITNGFEIGEEFISDWITHFKNRSTLLAQENKPCDENTLLELFKYITKMYSKSEREQGIYIDAIDTIFQVLSGKPTIQSYGFKLPKDAEETEESEQAEDILDSDTLAKLDAISFFKWNDVASDWLNIDTHEPLTGYKPSEELLKAINGITGSNPT